MLALSCSNDKNACVPSNSCMNINVEETQLIVEQDLNLSSSKINYSSSSITHCLMPKSSSSDGNDNNNDNNDDNNDEEEDMEKVNALLQNKGLMILKALPKNKNAQAILFEIMETLIERGETIRPQAQDEPGFNLMKPT